MSRCTVLALAVIAAQCGGRTSPTAPAAPSPASTIGVVRSVVVDRTNIEAGDEVGVRVVLDGAAPSSELRYTWSVDPPGGILTSEGASARWRAPLSDPVPATYTFLVSIVEPEANGSAARLTNTYASVAVASPAVTVNDARRELRAHSEAFLSDAVNAAVTPEVSVRNFADSCSGKRSALDDVSANRAQYSSGTIAFDLELFVRSIEWVNCTATDGSAKCAVLIYKVNMVLTRRADGAQEQVAGDQSLSGVYEHNRWWLCGSQLATGANPAR